jgi:hypothetical protein
MPRIRAAIVALSAAAALLAVLVGMLLILPPAKRPAAADRPSGKLERPLSAAERGYMARARYGEGEPVLDPKTMAAGDVGQLGTVSVLQLHGDGQLLAVADGVTLLVSGLKTVDLADGQQLDTFPLVFEVVGPKRYTTVAGAARTVMHVRPFDAWRVRRLVKEQATKAAEAR